ncbi:hypothetical protein [Virgisporangium aurantiacum]|uniref:hypothetical protein n=1 Tax=Virgisporangium aurantiacum TaxID=175570 RepID=UPI00195167D6|nr:hypothetical protein [Virgisporangium aurantiacum]
MRSSTRTAAALLAVGVLFVGSPAPAQGTWTRVATPNEPGDNFLYGADATDATHVWAVGAVVPRPRTVPPHSQILRYDGTTWRPAAASNDSTLYAVDAVTATEAWAVGTSRSSTLVTRWNGTAWAAEPSPNGNPAGGNTLRGVAAAGDTVWAVGNYLDSGTYASHGLALQRVGGTWRRSPTPRLSATDSFAAVDATGPADAWVVGYGSSGGISSVPVALRWNGSAWTSLPPPNPGYAGLSAVEAITPNNVWVAGYAQTDIDGMQPYIAQFNGTSWRRVAVPTIVGGGQLSDIVALSPTNILATGTGGSGGSSIVLHWNGSTWTRETAPDTVRVTAAAGVGPDTFWVVGIGFDLSAYQYRNFSIVQKG